MARPSIYREELADQLFERLATSDLGLSRICAQPDMPAFKTVWRWLEAKPELRQKYARAKEQQAEFMADQILAISDDGEADRIERVNEQGKPYTQLDHENINRSRLRVDARKWLASKLAPKKYGDRLELAGDANNPITISIAEVLRQRETAASTTPLTIDVDSTPAPKRLG